MLPNNPEQIPIQEPVRIEKLVHGGLGLGRLSAGKVVLVEGALPGEEVHIRVMQEQGSHVTAAVEAVLDASPERISAPCPFYADCGGCNIQHAEYTAQLRMKTAIVRESLQRAGLDMTQVILDPTRPSPQQFGYRYRLRLHLRQDGALGFHRRRSNDLVPVDRCLLATDGINTALSRLVQSKQLVARIAPNAHAFEFNQCPQSGRIALVLHTKKAQNRSLKALARLCAPLAGAVDSVGTAQGIVLHPSEKESKGVLLRRQFRHSGLSYELCWQPHSFFQVNCLQNESLVALATSMAAAGRRALDLFCGSGNFSIPLALRGAQVLGIESSPTAIRQARHNAAVTGLATIRFTCADASAELAHLYCEGARFDTILLDPPRQGLGKAASLLAKFQPRRIVSISCDPATHARDLRLMLAGGYRLIQVIPFDMFPQSHHIETMAVLEQTSLA